MSIETIKTFEFAQKFPFSYRIQLTKFNGRVMTGVQKFYQNPITKQYEPTKKQVWFARELWPQFCKSVSKVTAILNSTPGLFLFIVFVNAMFIINVNFKLYIKINIKFM